ncbi:MAG TPA: NAD(P)H-hydrate dehydratase [Acidimicrobiia bacterium]|nr:NAD(P)H-hydrate dehydratase [Acidimicrobiia bacterium]
MEPVVTPTAMAEADARAIAAGTPESVLVERAGRAVAWAARRMLDGRYGRRVVVACGKGNNGADGLVAARVLRTWGVRVDVVELVGGVDRAVAVRALERADLAIDAMYGTGFRGELDGDAAWIAGVLASNDVGVLAVDIPSGVDGHTGAVLGHAVRADATITFVARKSGLVFEPGRRYAGDVEVADIGIAVAPDLIGARMLGRLEVARVLPARPDVAHKWQAAVMVVGGSGGMTGAPLLASRAAMRSGSGMVFCALPGTDAARHASGGEVITRALPAVDDGALAVDAVAVVLEQIDRFGALALGPGLGGHPDTRRAVCDLVAKVPVPMVLDADGLNAVDGDLRVLADRGASGGVTVLTPHDGEYRRLMGRPVADDRIAAAQALADEAQAVVLLKGPTTVVAAPGSDHVILNPTGTPLLATAGTGDVLTGVIAAFLARGVGAFDAAAAAAWVHGDAARRAGQHVGTGLVAGDVVEALASTLA